MTEPPIDTIGYLKAFIKDLPDEMRVLVYYAIPYTNGRSEMRPLGDLMVEDTKDGKVLEIYPHLPDYW